MEKYTFTYQSVSSYDTSVRSHTRESVPKPFGPFIPKTNGNSDGHVVKKKIVPVASRPYEDDYNTRSSPARSGDGERYRQTSPLHDSPRKADDFHSRPARLSPLTPTANDYDDYGSNKGGHKPIGGTIKSDNRDGYNNGTSNGYGDTDYGRNREGTKPIGGTMKNYDGYSGSNGTGYGDYGRKKEGTKPIGGTIKNYDDHDGYSGPGYGDYGRSREWSQPIEGKSEPHDGYNGTNGYGNHGSNKEGHKPFGGIGTIRDHDNHNGYNGTNAYGNYGNNSDKEGRKPFGGIGTIADHNNRNGYNGTNPYGDYGNSGNKEGRKPVEGNNRNYDTHDGYNGTNGYRDGYGNNKEGRKPTGGTIRNYDNHDGYNGTNGYGDGYGNNKEGRKPRGDTIRNYDGPNGYGDQNNKVPIKPMVNLGGWSKPKFGFGWSAAPRKGTQLSEPTSDIGAAMELLKKEAANKMTLNDHSNKDHYDNYQLRHDGSSPLNNWARPPGNASRLSEPISKYEKDDYGESIDKRNAMRPYRDSNLSPRPRTSTHVALFDADYKDNDTSHYGIMDSTEAEKRFRGTRIS